MLLLPPSEVRPSERTALTSRTRPGSIRTAARHLLLQWLPGPPGVAWDSRRANFHTLAVSALGLCLVISHQSSAGSQTWLPGAGCGLCGLVRFGGGFSWRLAVDPIRQANSIRLAQGHVMARLRHTTQSVEPSPSHPSALPACPACHALPSNQSCATLRHCNSQRPIGPFPHLRHLAAKNSPTHTDGSGRRRNQEVKSPQRFHHPNDQSEQRQGVPVALAASNNLPELPGTDLECAVCYINKPEAVAQAREARHGRPGTSEAQTGSTLPHRRLRFDDKQEMAT